MAMGHVLYGSVPSPCRSGGPRGEAPRVSRGALGRAQAAKRRAFLPTGMSSQKRQVWAGFGDLSISLSPLAPFSFLFKGCALPPTLRPFKGLL